MHYFDKNPEATVWNLTVQPQQDTGIPHKATWGELSITQLYDLKSKMIGMQFGCSEEQKEMRAVLESGISHIDVLLTQMQTR